MMWEYRNVSGLQQERGNVARGQAEPDRSADLLDELRAEGLSGSHLQEEDHPLLPVAVVLGNAQAVGHLLKRLHCGRREGLGSAQREGPLPQITNININAIHTQSLHIKN